MSLIVKNITKTYEIDAENQKVGGGAKEFFKSMLRKVRSPFSANTSKKTFTALKEVSFQVKPGERVALIGENGAGKSTLLKILSGVTLPTTGSAVIIGKIASLLEIGAGFHPDLTGKENIFLNGAILGLSRGEVEKLYPNIVTFAEVEEFLETPVKHFSSGMRARLAFSIAIHTEPDLLILDEALSVGDQSFQQRCQEKVEWLAARGTTLLFVAHQIEPLLKLCQRGLYLEQGKLVMDGEIQAVISYYLAASSKKQVTPKSFFVNKATPMSLKA